MRAQDTTTDLARVVRETSRLLSQDPVAAERRAREILSGHPGHADGILLLAAALRRQGKAAEARALLEPLARQPEARSDVHLELGQALASLGEHAAALAALRRAVARNSRHAAAWRALAAELSLAGLSQEADQAHAEAIRASVTDPELIEAADALLDNRLAIAERLLRQRLKRQPSDVAAIRMLAEVAARIGRYEDAERLLARALELAPGFHEARRHYALVLNRQNRSAEALAQIEQLLARNPEDVGLRNLKAAALGQIGEYDAAIALYEEVLKHHSQQPRLWMSLGHVLKTVGRKADSIAAYRRCLALAPTLGEAWWSLANLKRVSFTPEDCATMRQALTQEISEEDRFHLHFALGKAEEDAGHFAESFRHYAEGNRLRRALVHYDPEDVASHVRRCQALFSADFLRSREGGGCPVPDPIFIVGMPRAGSTLIEQILSSHPLVEGTMELPDLPAMARRLGGRQSRSDETLYPDILATLSPEELAGLGQEYLERTRVQRKTDRPLMIDKLPNNFLHVGLIRLILPNAKIIDARRDPMGCCFSNFKQHFARGQTFSYDLRELGDYYARYVELMAHFDAVLPGYVHRVQYEDMVANTEAEVRRLLAFLGLPFDPACLRFYESRRAVRTASSEQVRQPIFQDGVDHWRHFEAWLDPLKEALAPVLPQSVRASVQEKAQSA